MLPSAPSDGILVSLPIPGDRSLASQVREHRQCTVRSDGTQDRNSLEADAGTMQALAAQHSHGVRHERCENQQRLGGPAQLPGRSTFRHLAIMRDVPIPFGVELLERAPSRMEDDHFRCVPKSKSGAQRTLSPLHVFGYVNAGKRADAIEVSAKHRHIAGA